MLSHKPVYSAKYVVRLWEETSSQRNTGIAGSWIVSCNPLTKCYPITRFGEVKYPSRWWYTLAISTWYLFAMEVIICVALHKNNQLTTYQEPWFWSILCAHGPFYYRYLALTLISIEGTNCSSHLWIYPSCRCSGSTRLLTSCKKSFKPHRHIFSLDRKNLLTHSRIGATALAIHPTGHFFAVGYSGMSEV